jgi:isoquinoline 1-oxidoreductase beta subunit
MDGRWHVNPGTIKAQVEGAIVMAPGAATIHEITFNDGMAGQNNFYSYKILGMTDVPPIDILWKPDSDAGGGGEPALPAFASALVNAIYDLTGKRVRKLPFGLDTVWSTVSEE